MNPNAIQKFNEELNKALNLMKFDNSVPKFEEWYYYAQLGLHHSSPVSLGISVEEFITMAWAPPDNINMYQFAILNNNLETSTAKQMGLSMQGYCTMQAIVKDYATIWTAKTDAIRAKITAEVTQEQQALEKLAAAVANKQPFTLEVAKA